MAQRRMFSLKITNSDKFLEMPLSSQCLYFHLSMNADDDGFVDGVNRIKRMVGASDDDLRLLLAKQFVIPFESGVCVIRHWRIHNYIQRDRYTPTSHSSEMSMLTVDNNGEKGAYIVAPPEPPKLPDNNAADDDNTNVSKMDTQVRLGKVRDRVRDRDRLEGKEGVVGGEEASGAGAPKRTRFIPPTVEEVAEYCRERENGIDAEHFVDHYTANGWKVSGKTAMKDWKAAVRTWEKNEFGSNARKGGRNYAGTRNGDAQHRGTARGGHGEDRPRVYDGEQVL